MKYYTYTRETEKKATMFGFWIAIATFLVLGFFIAIMGALKVIEFEKAILMVFIDMTIAIVVGGVARNIRLAFSSRAVDVVESKPEPEVCTTTIRRETRKERHRRMSQEENERLRRHQESLEAQIVGDADMTMMQADMYISARDSVSELYKQDVSTPVHGGCGGGIHHDVGSSGTSGFCGGGDTSTYNPD